MPDLQNFRFSVVFLKIGFTTNESFGCNVFFFPKPRFSSKFTDMLSTSAVNFGESDFIKVDCGGEVSSRNLLEK